MTTISTAMHTAHLDPMAGLGLLVLPAEDGPWLGMESMTATDWDAMVARLAGLGWRLALDDDGCLMEAGATADGRLVASLVALDPIDGGCDLARLAEAERELAASAGVLLAA